MPITRHLAVLMLILGVGVSALNARQPEDLSKLDIATLQRRAAAGDASSQNMIGVRYYIGKNVSQNYAQAAAWFRKAADQGNAQGQYALGSMYNLGQGVPRDFNKAFSLYRKAAEQGLASAQVSVGLMYSLGVGTAKDSAQSFVWYHKAADQGDAVGQYEIGVAYESGAGTTKNLAEAHRWLQLAANQGNQSARSELAVLSRLPPEPIAPQEKVRPGSSPPPSTAVEIASLRTKGAAGDAAAQCTLGSNYENGNGVRRSYRQALIWYHKAADQHDPSGEYHVGLAYEFGRGVRKNLPEAHRWFRLAAKGGFKDAKDELAKLSDHSVDTERTQTAHGDVKRPFDTSAQNELNPVKQNRNEKTVKLERNVDPLRDGADSLQGDMVSLDNCSSVVAAICEASVAKRARDLERARITTTDKQTSSANPGSKVSSPLADTPAAIAADANIRDEQTGLAISVPVTDPSKGAPAKANTHDRGTEVASMGTKIWVPPADTPSTPSFRTKTSKKRTEIASRDSKIPIPAADPPDAVPVVSYAGTNSSQVQVLLSKSPKSWSCPGNETDFLSPQPAKPYSLNCVRDDLVWAALQQAWAAECHSRLNMKTEAERNAGEVMRYVNAVKSLCANQLSRAAPVSCSTVNILSCSE